MGEEIPFVYKVARNCLNDIDDATVVFFGKLVGMHLVGNAFIVLARNMIFLGVVIFVFFLLSPMITDYESSISLAAMGPVLSTGLPITDTALSLANITLKSATVVDRFGI
ncbi:hypothetical protein I3760_06G063000 [Carya illinoinensis]|nr:hypothetical protein I3760_06G063000 [Carya illinoinensis]